MDDELKGLLEQLKGGEISRRDFMQKGMDLGMAGSSLGLLLHDAAPALAATARHAPRVRRGGTLRATIEGPSGGLDPALQQDDATISICHNIYNFVVRVDPHLVPYPDLATTWHSSPDGMTWTFPLQKGVRFHSGKPFGADDVIYTVKRIQNPKTGSAAASNLQSIVRIEKVDDHTVRFHLKAPNPDFPVVLADYHMCVVENNFTGNYTKNPSGTGPFMLKDFVPADHATIVRNPHYWQSPSPYLDAVKFVYLPQPSTQVAALKSSTVDFIIRLNPSQAASLAGASGIKVTNVSGTGFLNMRMRSDRPPFHDNRVRLAMKYVVDRKGINEAVMRGVASPGNDQPISPAFVRWYSDIGLRTRDVARAKALLAQAGYPHGLNVKLYASPFLGQTDFAVAYQSLAADAGIKVSIDPEPWTNYLARDWLQVPFGITSWASRPTPMEYLNLTFRSGGIWNEGHYSNPKLDALIDAVGRELEPAKRKSLFKQIEELLSNDGPSIIPFYTVNVYAMSARVQGLPLMSDGFHYYKTAWLSS
jgi:peptide/nickel transport system substrate-binding protein